VTEAVAARYREILPPAFANGPLLSMAYPGGGGLFFGNFVLHFPLFPATYRLEQFAKMAFGDLPETVAGVAKLWPAVSWAAIGTTCHVRVTSDEVRIWFGHSDHEDDAVLNVRPIPRADLGI
jgi:hypothetical protein